MRERYINLLPLICPQLGTWPTTQAPALTGKGTCDVLIDRLALNALSHISQGRKKIIYWVEGWGENADNYN